MFYGQLCSFVRSIINPEFLESIKVTIHRKVKSVPTVHIYMQCVYPYLLTFKIFKATVGMMANLITFSVRDL